jgi:hypothetical protein
MNRLPAAVILAAVVLAACAPPQAPTPPPAPAAAVQAPAPSPEPAKPAGDDCDGYVARLVDELVARRAKGATEDDALALLSSRGDFRLSYVVDGVFHADDSTPAAITRADILATCRRVNETGTTY